MTRNKTYINGKLVLEDYYACGGHTYLIPQGRGKRRATVTVKETPRGDGEVLDEYDGGKDKLYYLLQVIEDAEMRGEVTTGTGG
jgi:hypothetical protein